MSTWEDEIVKVMAGYADGEHEVQKRRALWPTAVKNVLLPTLEEAAEILRKHSNKHGSIELGHPHARHITFGSGPPGNGPKIEAVQLYTGQSDLLGFLQKPANGSTSGLVFEIGATLGYSLGVSGRVARWHIDHWLTNFNRHGEMKQDEMIPDASHLTGDMVRGHVMDFLRYALTTSYTARVAKNSTIGFAFEDATVVAAK